MKITDIRTMQLTGPREHDLGGSEGTIDKLVIRVDTDSGIYGLGEADAFLGVRDAVDYIRQMIVGRDPTAIRPIVSEMMYGSLPPHPPLCEPRPDDRFRPVQMCSPTATPTGPIAWAVSGVEIALCDLVGKAAGIPVYSLLGGKFRDRIAVYLDRSCPDEVGDLDAWRELSQEVEQGFKHIKFDIDYAAPDGTRDFFNRSLSTHQIMKIVERFGAVREAIGWEVELSADGHMHYHATDAIRLAQELAPLKLAWLEDPTPILNPDSCRAVRNKSPIPICVGEMLVADQIRQFIDSQACDIVHPDVMFCGGLHEVRRIADYAELHHIPLALHGNGGGLATIAAAHAAAASRNFLALEYHFIESDWIGGFVRREGVELFEDGAVRMTDAPGLGVELDEKVCRAHLSPGESLF